MSDCGLRICRAGFNYLSPVHLYLHVPFCVRRCSYCDFSIAVRKRIPAEEYVDAILSEWGSADRGPAGRGEAFHTIYFGGGTPSLLPPEAIADLLGVLTLGCHPEVNQPTHGADVEVTLEANPEDVTPDTARAWHRAGINRVSLGAQSFDDNVLKWMQRSHDAARIGAAVHALRGAGIDNISLDLIFALPAELQRDWERDLDLALSLLPSHLSLYGLTVEERTPLARWISRGAVAAPDDDRYAEEYLLAHVRLAAYGYHFYEVSNACRDERHSRHNSAYWSGRPYLGLGPAAHSYDGRARRWNVAAWPAYARAVVAGRSPVASAQVLAPAPREPERGYPALRTDAGLPVTALDSPRPPSTTRWIEHGWAEVNAGRLVCTPQGWLRLDALVGDLTSTDAMV